MEKSQQKRHKITDRQIKYITAYLTFGTATFSNAYQAALQAGYSLSYSRRITAYHSWQELEERLKNYQKK